MASQALKARLERLGKATAAKLCEKERVAIVREYESELEQVGPAPGRPWDQHDTMVSQGLCEAAVKAPGDNRYCNLFPFDTSRVVLTGLATDYINASWVEMPGLENKLILTMAPLHPDSKELNLKVPPQGSGDTASCAKCSAQDGRNTCPQFWRMVEQEEVAVVVMLCKVQPGFTGCSQYFPAREFEGKLKHGEFQVETVRAVSHRTETADYEGIILRDIKLTGLSGEVRDVKHIQLTAWPNYGVVDSLPELLEFIRKVHGVWTEAGGPLVVHCSGGVGRSGTFTTILTIFNLLTRAVQTGDLTSLENYLGDQEEMVLTDLVRHLRTVRHPWMVEGEEQYILAYQAVLGIIHQLSAECEK